MSKLYTLLFLLLLVAACGSKDNGCSVKYGFEFPLSVTSQDTFSVGDTIWYEMALPNQLLDKNSGNYYDFTDYELYFDLSMGKSDTNFIYDATHLFDIYAEIGRVEQEFNYFIYTSIYFNGVNDKRFKIGLIPKRKGSYYTGVRLTDDFLDKEISGDLNIEETKCWEHLQPDTYAYTNDGHSNYYLVDGLCQYSSYDSLLGCFDDPIKFTRGNYAFYVNN